MKLFWLDEIRHDQTEVGGKALAIAQLRQAGFPVPNGFVINDLVLAQKKALVIANTHQDSEAFSKSELKPNDKKRIQTEILKFHSLPNLFVVRSSAIGEDSLNASFAGQFKSFLNVDLDNLESKIIEVWQSNLNHSVKNYRHSHNLQSRQMAVLVQPIIHADIAGVAFSRDPVSGKSQVVINAVKGLGDRLMSGEVSGQSFAVNRFNQIIEQPREITILNEQQILEITQLVRDVEAYFNQPQDIEWAIANNQLYLLQARPITTLDIVSDPEGLFQLWDNSNIIESYSGITTPLTFSFAKKAYTEVYQQFCLFMGVSPQKVSQSRTIFQNMIGFIQGRIYYNLLNWYRVLAMLPALKMNARFMEKMMGVKKELPEEFIAEIQAESKIKNWGDRRESIQTIFVLIWNFFTLENCIKKYYQRIDSVLACEKSKTRPHDMSLWRADELVAHYRDVEEKLLAHWDAPLINDFFAMIFYGLLGSTVQKWCGDESSSLLNGLVAATKNVVSAEPLALMHEMAELLSPSDTELLAQGDLKDIQGWLKSNPNFHKKYQAYLEKFGDRCLGELKLESPTLKDNSLLLFRSIAQISQAPKNAHSPQNNAQQDAEGLALKALQRHPIRKLLFKWTLKETRRLIRNRENLRFERTRVFGLARQIFVQLGRRFTHTQTLNSPEDIFYLEVEEIMGFVGGTSTCINLQNLADLRRQEFEKYRQQPSPGDRLTTRGIIYQGYQWQKKEVSEPSAFSAERQGKSCAVGRVKGEVRVVKDAQRFLQEQSHKSSSGYILVAESTDPGWVLLFPYGLGLLVERGSVLSHVAIVCRELGLPMITDLTGITQWLKDGDFVEIDGATGKIYKQDTEVIAP